MKSYKAYRDGQFLSKVDVNPKTIAAPNKPPKPKLVLFFDGSEKGLIMNMSHGDFLAEATGNDDPEEWIGYEVELFVDDNVTYGGKRIGGIRLRAPQEQPA